jgi:hypothetical protein
MKIRLVVFNTCKIWDFHAIKSSWAIRLVNVEFKTNISETSFVSIIGVRDIDPDYTDTGNLEALAPNSTPTRLIAPEEFVPVIGSLGAVQQTDGRTDLAS